MGRQDNILPVDAYRALLERQEKEEQRRGRRKVGHDESALQRACVAWFRMQYPEHAPLLFAVPNGGRRSRTEAAIMKAEGVTAGVADLILLEARGGFGALCLEMKTESKDSRQSVGQKEWQKATERWGNKYVVCRTFEQFEEVVRKYMAMPMTNGRVFVPGKEFTNSISFCGHTTDRRESNRKGR